MQRILIATLAAFVAWPLAVGAATDTPRAVMTGPGAAAAGDVFERYEDAFDSHDADAVASFWELDPATEAQTRARWKGEREFEAATHAVFRISAKSLGGDAFQVTQSEDCDFYDELGTGTRTSTFVVHLRGGKFHDAERGTTTDASGSYDTSRAMFEVWMARNRPEQASVVMKEGELVFNGSTAPVIMELVREWQKRKR